VAGDEGPLFAGAADSLLDPVDALAPPDVPELSVEVDGALWVLGALVPLEPLLSEPLLSDGLLEAEL
jgi:hypothetical protein